MDEIDLAQIREHEILTAALSRRRFRLSSPDGMCIWCRDMPVIPGTAFCSADCGDDFDKEQRLRTRTKHSLHAEADEYFIRKCRSLSTSDIFYASTRLMPCFYAR